jgi:heme oxygenase
MLKRLKTATGTRHAALERLLPLLDAGMTAATYRQLLQRWFGFYEPLEAQMLAAPWWGIVDLDYAPRHKTPRLRHDLLALGGTVSSMNNVPRCEHLPPLSSPAALWGCLYVIEGATLGGQIITKHLHAHLGLTADSGASFFEGYGPQTGPRWKAFCAALTAQGDTAPGGPDAMLNSANMTFDLLSEWLFPGSTSAAEAPTDRSAWRC